MLDGWEVQFMEKKEYRKGESGSTTFDSLLKLLPLLTQSYPGMASLLSQLTGSSPATSPQVQEAVPKIIQALVDMDQETKEELVDQLIHFVPELEELLKKQG